MLDQEFSERGRSGTEPGEEGTEGPPERLLSSLPNSLLAPLPHLCLFSPGFLLFLPLLILHLLCPFPGLKFPFSLSISFCHLSLLPSFSHSPFSLQSNILFYHGKHRWWGRKDPDLNPGFPTDSIIPAGWPQVVRLGTT